MKASFGSVLGMGYGGVWGCLGPMLCRADVMVQEFKDTTVQAEPLRGSGGAFGKSSTALLFCPSSSGLLWDADIESPQC